ncbi:hypothetical protein [Mucilaginibacter sp. UYCu711]|uniref:hypothetical protein n=1 Tax=Mucilaginibacter sp. UYCu711 TaxID=3156339 RepID=UPI003D204CA6
MVDNEVINNSDFISLIEKRVNVEISAILDALMQKDEVKHLVKTIQAEIKKNKGILRIQNDMVSLDTYIHNSDININISTDDLFSGLMKLINRYRKELIARGFSEYPTLNVWTDNKRVFLNLRLTSYSAVRTSIIERIKEDKSLILFIESYERTFIN